MYTIPLGRPSETPITEMRKNMDYEKTHEDVLHGKIINIGFGTQLQVELMGREGHFKSILVGMEPDKYLLIKLPMMPGILNKLYEGNRVTVRYMYSGSVYGFHSIVLHYVTKPSSLLFVAYPKTIEVLQLRNSKRVDCLFPGKAKIQEKEYTGTIEDISTGGCRFSIPTSDESTVPKMEIGESIQLSFQLIGCPQPQTVSGIVRGLSLDLTKVVVGIQFDAVSKETVDSIEALIESFWQ
jgi:c-di-GMP-binding flagellar brake protein YcgR